MSDMPIRLSAHLRRESAAIAGVIYAVLAGASLWVINSVPRGLGESEWLEWIDGPSHRGRLYWAVSLGSVSAVAFLWFVAVVRRRLGDREDRFFATVFLGSGLVYVSLWLVALALVAAPLLFFNLTGRKLSWESYQLAEALLGSLLLFASPRIQALFVASTSTMFLRTGAVPRWLGLLGLVLAVGMFALPLFWTPIGMALPLFVLVVSVTVLFAKGHGN